MKRIFLLLLCILLFSSCNSPITNNDPTPAPTNVQTLTIKDYYPFVTDRRMKYEGKGMEYAEKDVYVDYIKDNRIQLRSINPGTTMAEVLENANGELRVISSEGEFYFRDCIIDRENDKPDILIKEPLLAGNTWQTSDNRKRYISGLDVEIETASGKYKALEITTEGPDYTTKDYYVKDIGFVKSIFKTNDSTIETSLEKIQENTPVIQTIKLYYPDFNNNRLVYIKQKVSFKTNDSPNNVFQGYFRNPPKSGITKNMGPNAKINKLYLNISEHKVYVDFSKEFVTEMNAGASFEGMLLQSVVNTLGDYYNVDKVQITLDGKPYESGHILIKEDEPMYVDYKNIFEIK